MASEPRWLTLARTQIGLTEIKKRTAGMTDNPVIVDYWRRAKILKKDEVSYWEPGNDETPWCAAFIGAILADCGLKGSGKALARSYGTWGEPVMTGDKAMPWASILLGGIVVLNRPSAGPTKGHVGFASGASEKFVRLIGGNQNDSVSEAWFPKTRIVAVRWPKGEPVSEYLMWEKAPAKAGRGARTA
jgi:uncharacterized protein (TIGR02594 family)